MPVEVIELEDPETQGLAADALKIIGEKVTYRLVQQRCGDIVLK